MTVIGWFANIIARSQKQNAYLWILLYDEITYIANGKRATYVYAKSEPHMKSRDARAEVGCCGVIATMRTFLSVKVPANGKHCWNSLAWLYQLFFVILLPLRIKCQNFSGHYVQETYH
jgi:hypothetical protein